MHIVAPFFLGVQYQDWSCKQYQFYVDRQIQIPEKFLSSGSLEHVEMYINSWYTKKSWIGPEAASPSHTALWYAAFSGVRRVHHPVQRDRLLAPQRVFVVLGIVAARLALLSFPQPSSTLPRTTCACGGSGNKGLVEVSVSFIIPVWLFVAAPVEGVLGCVCTDKSSRRRSYCRTNITTSTN